MNDNQREMLTTCLTQVFGRVEDDFVDGLDPLLRWIDLPGGETLFSEGDAETGEEQEDADDHEEAAVTRRRRARGR